MCATLHTGIGRDAWELTLFKNRLRYKGSPHRIPQARALIMRPPRRRCRRRSIFEKEGADAPRCLWRVE